LTGMTTVQPSRGIPGDNAAGSKSSSSWDMSFRCYWRPNRIRRRACR
jgi:hypothetical protein